MASLLTVIFSDKLSTEETEIIKNGIFILCIYIFGESGIDIVRILRYSFENGEKLSELLSESVSNGIANDNTICEECITEVKKEEAL